MRRFDIALPFIIPFAIECWKAGMLKPPIVAFKDRIDTHEWSSPLADFLIDYNLRHYPLHDIMLRQEPQFYLPDSSGIAEERRNERWSELQKVFSLTL